MHTEDLEQLVKAATGLVKVVRNVQPPVKRVKGFDMNSDRAARRKLQRAKAHQTRMARNPSHTSQPKPPIR